MRHQATDHLGFEIALSFSQKLNGNAGFTWGSTNGTQQRGGFTSWDEAFKDACKSLNVDAKPEDYTNV